MLQYLDRENKWQTLDLMAVKGIYPEGMGCVYIRMKDGSLKVGQYIESR